MWSRLKNVTLQVTLLWLLMGQLFVKIGLFGIPTSGHTELAVPSYLEIINTHHRHHHTLIEQSRVHKNVKLQCLISCDDVSDLHTNDRQKFAYDDESVQTFSARTLFLRVAESISRLVVVDVIILFGEGISTKLRN